MKRTKARGRLCGANDADVGREIVLSRKQGDGYDQDRRS